MMSKKNWKKKERLSIGSPEANEPSKLWMYFSVRIVSTDLGRAVMAAWGRGKLQRAPFFSHHFRRLDSQWMIHPLVSNSLLFFVVVVVVWNFGCILLREFENFTQHLFMYFPMDLFNGLEKWIFNWIKKEKNPYCQCNFVRNLSFDCLCVCEIINIIWQDTSFLHNKLLSLFIGLARHFAKRQSVCCAMSKHERMCRIRYKYDGRYFKYFSRANNQATKVMFKWSIWFVAKIRLKSLI